MIEIKAGLGLDVAVAKVVAHSWRVDWIANGDREIVVAELREGDEWQTFRPSEDANDAIKAADMSLLFDRYCLRKRAGKYVINYLRVGYHYVLRDWTISQPTIPLVICEAILRLKEAEK